MDNNVLDISGNLLFLEDGSTWAVWRVLPTESARSTGDQLRTLYERTLGLMKSLRGEVMLASLCEQIQPQAIVRRCLDGVDIDTNEHWAETIHNAWEQLDDLDVMGRTYWIAKPLSGGGWKDATRALARAAGAATGKALGVTAHPISRSTVRIAHERANTAAQELGSSLPMRPATEAELFWWLARAPVRGVYEPQLEEAAPAPGTGSLAARTGDELHNSGIRMSTPGRRSSLAMLRGSLLDEAGRTDYYWEQARGATRSKQPGLAAMVKKLLTPMRTLNRRFLKCLTPTDDGLVESYQAYLTLAEMPRAFRFPGSEILARLSGFGFGVDYALHITAKSNEEARASNRKRTRNLMDQDEEHGADSAGIPADLIAAQEEQQDKNARLGDSSTEIELEVGVVACVWADTAEECEERAKLLRGAFLGSEYRWERPLGGQQQLYEAMQPGGRVPMVLREHAQNLLASDAAMLLPFSSFEFGDPTGSLFGMTLDSGSLAPFLLDPTYGPTHDSSGGIAAVGELGAGKSVVLKNVAAVVRLMLNGRVIAVDRTRQREWTRVAAALPGDNQIVDIIDPKLADRRESSELFYSCDPLRVFSGKTSTGIAEVFFAAWLDLESNSPERDALDRALDEVSGEPGASSNALIETLAAHGKRDTAAHALAERLSRLRRDPITKTIFDPELPPVDLFGADMVVFCTNEVPMPSELEMSNERMAARLSPRKLFGRAFHLLIAAIAKEVCFGSDRWGEFICDEAYSVTGTPEGQAIALEFVRDGRKHAADMAFGSHAPKDLGDDVLQGLIAVRFVGRHRDPKLARQCQEWLGIPAQDEHYQELITSELSPTNPKGGDAERRARAGEFLVRDHSGRIAKVKVGIQPYRTLPQAVLTTPTIDRSGPGARLVPDPQPAA